MPAKTETTLRRMLWTLLVSLMAASLLLMAKHAQADITNLTFTVNSTGDPGSGGCNSTECTLREAIALSNRVEGADTIRFNIPGEGVKTISPTSELPTITEAVTIDGYTQPGASPNTLGKGTNAKILIELDGSNAVGVNGLLIEAPNTAVRGLTIKRFDNSGIKVRDNPTTSVKIEGNFIGTDASGTVAEGNDNGVEIIEGADGTTIGGTTPEARNLTSGNSENGIRIDSGDGRGSIPRVVRNNQVVGNLIGTKKDGTSPLGNGREGVKITSPGAPDGSALGNLVGGATPASANTIAFNALDGVLILGSDSTRNRVLSNSIFANKGLGIDLLGADESTFTYMRSANDPRDADVGPNGLQNKPAIASATNSGGKTTMTGKLLSKPNETFVVRFFSNPSNTDEGKALIGQKAVKTGSDGKGTFTFVPPGKVGAGKTVTATATGVEGSSEFSAPRTVVAQ